MNRCSDNLSGSPSFTVSTRKIEEGKWEASCASLPLKPVTAAEERDAINLMSQAIQRHVVSGGKSD